MIYSNFLVVTRVRINSGSAVWREELTYEEAYASENSKANYKACFAKLSPSLDMLSNLFCEIYLPPT